MYKYILLTLIISFFGCGNILKKEPDLPCRQENTLAPEWICTPMVEGTYASIGIAKVSTAGFGHMRRVALADARLNLAKQIQSQVKRKVETFTKIVTLSDTISKQIEKIDLQNSKAFDVWKAPSGIIYMLVTIPQTTVNREVQIALKTLKKQFKSKKILKELENEFSTN